MRFASTFSVPKLPGLPVCHGEVRLNRSSKQVQALGTPDRSLQRGEIDR